MQTRAVESVSYGPPVGGTRKTVAIPAGLRVKPVTRYPMQTRPQFWLDEFPPDLFPPGSIQLHDAQHYGVWLELHQLDATRAEQLDALAGFPDEFKTLRPIRVTFADGNTLTTNINATRAEVVRHYVGTPFQFGDREFGDPENMQAGVSVEFLD